MSRRRISSLLPRSILVAASVAVTSCSQETDGELQDTEAAAQELAEAVDAELALDIEVPPIVPLSLADLRPDFVADLVPAAGKANVLPPQAVVPGPPTPFVMDETTEEEWLQDSIEDDLWYSPNGERFDTLLVLQDGTAYGPHRTRAILAGTDRQQQLRSSDPRAH